MTPITARYSLPAQAAKAVKIAHDGLVYVCDRSQNRIQIFKKDGTFVREWFYEKNSRGNGAVFDIALWPDPSEAIC